MSYISVDASPLATYVVREDRVTYANDALGRLLEARRELLVGLDHLDLFAPEDRARIDERYHRRLRGESVPTEYEVTLLTLSGRRVPAQLSVSRDGDNIVVHVQDRSESFTRREKLDALAQLGAAIQADNDSGRILERVTDGLFDIGVHSLLVRRDGEVAEVVGTRLAEGSVKSFETAAGRPLVGMRTYWIRSFARAWEQGASFFEEAAVEAGALFEGELGAALRSIVAAAVLKAIATLRLDVGGEPTYVLTVAGAWIREEDLPALRLFGAQVSAALTAARVIGDLSRRNAELAALNRLAAAARTATDRDSLFREALGDVGRAFGAAGTVVFLLEPESRQLKWAYAEGIGGRGRERLSVISVDNEWSNLGQVVRAAEPQVFEIEELNTFARGMLEDSGVKVMASIPLMARSAVVGILNLMFTERRAVTPGELELMHAMGAHFGAAVESQRLLADLRQRVDELSLTNQVSQALAESLDIRQVLDTAARNLARVIEAPRSALLLLDPAHGQMVVQAAHGMSGVGSVVTLGPATPILNQALSKQEVVVVSDTATVPEPHPWISAVGAASLIVLPLVVHGKAIGVAIVIDTTGPRAFQKAELERATAISRQIAVALENARLYDDLKRSYAALARTQAQLVERERLAAIGELAATVAHEVRNPLNVIFNALGGLKRAPVQGNSQLLLDIVGEECERLNRIVGDLLDYARPLVLDLRPVPLRRVIEDALATLPSIEGKIRVDCEVDSALAEVPLDARLVRQVVQNLALNALQAMPRGGSLSVHARPEYGPGGEVARIDVMDTGSGIPFEVRHRIFEPFFTTKPTGTGLGLAVVKRIVESHRGNVSVASEAGRGTTFTIRLPLEAPPSEGGALA